MRQNKYLITTPIYYVNDVPHVGGAYTTLSADVLARAHRQMGDDVLFLTGTDEHGAKIAQKAAELGLKPEDYTLSITEEFVKSWKSLSISYDQFARTTNEKHKYLVGQLVQRLYDTDHLYEGTYEGWYCVGCEEYKDVSEGEVNPLCEVHQKPLEYLKEKSYYFRLSAFQDRLIELIETDLMAIKPVSRKNEVLSFLKGQLLRDIPVTRTKVEWGIPVPFAPDQTIYVWIDALFNYLSFSDGDVLANDPTQAKWWPANLHILGKDILRFHAVIWPALLMALELPLPKELFVHGFFTMNGQKMSKSLGNVVRPDELIARYGVDATRYLILSAVPYGSDGDISIEKMDAVYTSQLANGLGNLLQRVIVLINKFGIKPQVSTPSITQIQKAYRENDLSEAFAQTMQLVDDANRYIAAEQPWAMTNDALRETVLVHCYEELLRISEAITPVMPDTAGKIKKQLNELKPEPLFPRLP